MTKSNLLLNSLRWFMADVNDSVYSNAHPTGMNFWYPAFQLAFYSDTPSNPTNGLPKFFFEALCVL